jgi:transcriptional regulator with XRE-family HTH domain
MGSTLRDIRLSLKLSQEYMARAGSISLQTYRNAELGGNVTFTTATVILEALNKELGNRGKSPVDLFTLGLSIV